MQGGAVALIVNIAVAAMFAGSFTAVAALNRAHRKALWFSASYLIGMLTPVSELLLPLSSWPEAFVISSYLSFAIGLSAMTAALSVFYRRAPPWIAIGGLVAFTAVNRILIWGGERNTLPYEILYQLPFALAAAMSGIVVVRNSERRPLEVALAIMFGLVAAHFLVKPFLAVTLGSGQTAQQYMASAYALISQASTGILLMATGLLVLLIVTQRAIKESEAASETDSLSGLANRRGFDSQASVAIARARRYNIPMALVLFDLDHFKSINDTYGHAVGDQVIAAFASLLRRAAPQGAIIARLGGEEFALLLERTTVEGARLQAEAIRIATSCGSPDTLPKVTVSAGVTMVFSSESPIDAFRRADAALYEAKRGGRDCVCALVDQPSSVVSFRSRSN